MPTPYRYTNGAPIEIGDIAVMFDDEYHVVWEAAAYGLTPTDGKAIDYEKLGSKIHELTGCDNTPSFCGCDDFVSLWELVWNFGTLEDDLDFLAKKGC